MEYGNNGGATSIPSKVIHLQQSCYRQAAAVLAQAFRDDPLTVTVLRGLEVEGRSKTLENFFWAALCQTGTDGVLMTVPVQDGIGGVCIVHRPGAYPPSLSSQVGVLW